MKRFAALLSLFFCFGVLNVSPQTDNARVIEPLENISVEISSISRSLETLNKKLSNFTETFDSNQGLRLTEKQQRLLFAFEMLNRAETRLSTLQLLKVQLSERETTAKRRIAQLEESLRPERVDRSLNGTLDAEQARAARRRALENERSDVSRRLGEIQNSIYDTDTEILQTQQFLKRIRGQIFPGVEKEISDL